MKAIYFMKRKNVTNLHITPSAKKRLHSIVVSDTVVY